jgi:GT2 family glycosyltransferase
MICWPKVSIIILNWNNYKDTIECLESVYQNRYPYYNVILVDNGSTNESVIEIVAHCKNKLCLEIICLNCDLKNAQLNPIGQKRDANYKDIIKNEIIIIKNRDNYGYAIGNNIGIAYALKNYDIGYILILNNDVIVQEDFLIELVKASEADTQIGITGPKIFYYCFDNRKDIINFAGGIMKMWRGRPYHIGINKEDGIAYTIEKEVDYANGACILAKRELIEKIGLLNSEFFLYWEENDFCIRAKMSGFKVVFAPNALIWHKTAASIKNLKGLEQYYMVRNRFYFMRKYASNLELLFFILYFFIFEFLYLSIRNLIYSKNKSAFFRGVWDGLRYMMS